MDKFAWHIPLYRQHQRLEASGIRVSRPWLTQLAQVAHQPAHPDLRGAARLDPRNRVKAMDETPIKAGRSGHGKMHTGYFWPIYGSTTRCVFRSTPRAPPISSARRSGSSPSHNAVLVTDGYAAYEQYAEKTGIQHASCWSHARRASSMR